jgi:hypothetical protein
LGRVFHREDRQNRRASPAIVYGCIHFWRNASGNRCVIRPRPCREPQAAANGRIPPQAAAKGRVPPQAAAKGRVPAQAAAKGRVPPQAAAKTGVRRNTFDPAVVNALLYIFDSRRTNCGPGRSPLAGRAWGGHGPNLIQTYTIPYLPARRNEFIEPFSVLARNFRPKPPRLAETRRD